MSPLLIREIQILKVLFVIFEYLICIALNCYSVFGLDYAQFTYHLESHFFSKILLNY